MNIRVSAGALLSLGLMLAGCASATPIVASERATGNALLASLQQAGLCEDATKFTRPAEQVLGELEATCTSDDLTVTFFEPSGNGTITVLFWPDLCLVELPPEPMVFGLNWTITAGPNAPEDALEKAASVTSGSLTTTNEALALFCEAFANN
jgi:hypothetical protein